MNRRTGKPYLEKALGTISRKVVDQRMPIAGVMQPKEPKRQEPSVWHPNPNNAAFF